ncbi:probable serine/threonine-protein kinase kinX [Dysidea avara]|uniref:probable serine/threonine-protein kinase kinX n=1 Tax=Dysidea avara TaxID=196820 RepID=UPI00331D64AD
MAKPQVKRRKKQDQFEELNELKIDNVVLGEVIGRGAGGKILRGSWEGASCAVKEIFQEIASEEEFTWFLVAFIEECRRSIRLRHPNIVQVFGVYFPPSESFPRVVTELLHGNLTSFLETNPKLSHRIKLSILHDISLGLRFLHTSSPPIIHRDLTSNNVLISRGYVAKIGDFGTARFLNPHNQIHLLKMSQLAKAPGTVDFMPPEIMFDNPQYSGTPLDVFSFACVSLHIITQKWPSLVAPLQLLSEAERRARFLDMFYEEALSLKPMLLQCLDNNSNIRPSIVDICAKLEILKGPNDQLPLPYLLGFRFQTSGDINSQPQRGPDANPQFAVKYWEHLEKVWESCADLPSTEQVDNVTLIDGNVYVEGNNDVFCYNSNNDSWTILPPLPVHSYSLACVVPLGQLLAIGGYSQCGITNQVLLWDAAEKCWHDDIITSRMVIARSDATAVGYHSSVIVIGGVVDNKQSTTQSVEVLEIDLDNLNAFHWYTVRSIPFGACNSMTAIIDDRLYVAGGYMNDTGVSHMTSASISSLLSSKSSTLGVWSEVSHLPYTTESFTSYKDHLLIFGGDYLQRISNNDNIWKAVPSIYLYHVQRKQWEVVDKIPCNYYFGRCAHLSPSKIMFIGGQMHLSISSPIRQCRMLTLTEHT